MIFAAGLGTRLKPLTNTMPKALVQLNGHSLLEHTISKLMKVDSSEIIINVHHFAYQIIDFIHTRHWNIPIKISDESIKLLNTGGGLKKAASLFTPSDSPILIHNVDIISNADLLGLYNKHIASKYDALLLVSKRKSSRLLLFDDTMRLMGWQNINTGEIKSPFKNLKIEKLNKFAFSGIHTFSPTLFTDMDNYCDVFSIIDFYLNECIKRKIYGYVQQDLQMLDVGKLDSLEEAEYWLSKKMIELK